MRAGEAVCPESDRRDPSERGNPPSRSGDRLDLTATRPMCSSPAASSSSRTNNGELPYQASSGVTAKLICGMRGLLGFRADCW